MPAPIFHAIQYLFGKQTREQLERFRAFGGAQSYPSRTKDADDVDFSTGSVGLGVAMTAFASLVQDYVQLKGLMRDGAEAGRMIAIVGDAELDEGNIYEALIESWKHDIRNTWWIIDYNRQSLDAVITDRLFAGIESQFKAVGWRVVTLKYGKRLEAAFRRPDGAALRQWIDDCPNSLYSALVFKGGRGWREHLLRDLGQLPGIRKLLDEHDDDGLAALMTNLAGHDMESLLDAFHAVTDDQRICFVVYTIKGFGLPFAGHKDNHAGLMNPDQMAEFKRRNRIADGAEWDRFAGLDLPAAELERIPPAGAVRVAAGAPALRGATRAGAAEAAALDHGEDVDAGGLRPHPRRSRPRGRRRSPTASSRPRPTSPSPPTSAAGSTAAASSIATGARTCSASRRWSRPSAG